MRRAILVLVLLAACGKAPPNHPNVLLVTIDTLRADALGPGTPALNAFLREATRFRNARTVAPLTLVAHTSLFSGVLPARHGIHDNVTEPLPPRAGRPFPLLAEQFRDAGYATAAFVARAVLAAQTGVGSGFDLYDCPKSEGEREDTGGYVPGEERVRAPIAWIEGARSGKPWFVWVHLFDPHMPYRAFPGDAQRAATRDTDPPEALYAGEVRRADAAVEKLLREVPADTIVVIASDHGEGLMDHGEAWHGPLCYGSTVDVLLSVRGKGFARGAEDQGLRSLMDIAPTLRRACDLPSCDTDGKDLAGAPHDTLVTESLLANRVDGCGQAFAVADGRFTLVEGGASLELFDRRQDPGESTPLKLADPAYEKLDRALERFRSGTWGGAGGQGGEMLESVAPYTGLRRDDKGYLSRHENSKLLNPGDHLKVWVDLEGIPPLIKICTDRRDAVPLEGALRTLDAFRKEIPQSPRVDHYRAGVLAALGNVTGATARYGEAAWSEIAAIEKGYVQGALAPAIAYCVAASDADALRALVKVLRRLGTKLDSETERSLVEATKKLGLSEADSFFGVR